MDRLAGRIVHRLQENPEAPNLVGLDDDTAGQIFDALAAETSRAVLSSCYEQPGTVSELADELDTSVQNAAYHVEKLTAAALLEPVKTRYGSNGQEITVYGPTKEAIVLVAGDTSFRERLAKAARHLFGPVLLAAFLSIAAGVWAGTDWGLGRGMDDESGLTGTETVLAFDWMAAVTAFLIGCLIIIVLFRRSRRERTNESRHRIGYDCGHERHEASLNRTTC